MIMVALTSGKGRPLAITNKKQEYSPDYQHHSADAKFLNKGLKSQEIMNSGKKAAGIPLSYI